jgi:hypothetical protein
LSLVISTKYVVALSGKVKAGGGATRGESN